MSRKLGAIQAHEERTANLRLSEERLSVLIKDLPLGVISWNERFECVLWNPAAEKIFGYTADEASGDNAFKLIVPRELHSHIDGVFADLMNQTGGTHSTNENITKDGRTILCEWFNTPLVNEYGNAIGVASVVQDITQQATIEEKLQQSERTFRRFFEVIPDVFMITDLTDGTCAEVNDGFVSVTGYSREDVIGKMTLDLHLWESEEDRLRLVRALRQDGRVRNLAANFRKKDGTIWAGIMSGCLIDYEGRPHALTATKDVSDLRRFQHELEGLISERTREFVQAKNDAERASQAKSDFLALMSHELRTPLNAISGFSQILESEIFGKHSNSRYREYSRDIIAAADHLIGIVNDVLDLSKIEAGKLHARSVDVALGPFLDDTAKVFNRRHSGNGDRVSVRIGDGADHLLADPRLLRQALLNLLSNADKYSSTHTPIFVETHRAANGETVIEVIDSGVGIAPEDIEKVLEPFGQARSDTEIAHEGTGLGLPISQRLTELQNGRLELESSLGQGTTVRLVFPGESSTGLGNDARS